MSSVKKYNYDEYGNITSIEDIEGLFDCSKTTAIRMLNKLVDRRLLRRVNSGKKTYYVINQYDKNKKNEIGGKKYE